jgi:hypothetical protein
LELDANEKRLLELAFSYRHSINPVMIKIMIIGLCNHFKESQNSGYYQWCSHQEQSTLNGVLGTQTHKEN